VLEWGWEVQWVEEQELESAEVQAEEREEEEESLWLSSSVQASG